MTSVAELMLLRHPCYLQRAAMLAGTVSNAATSLQLPGQDLAKNGFARAGCTHNSPVLSPLQLPVNTVQNWHRLSLPVQAADLNK